MEERKKEGDMEKEIEMDRMNNRERGREWLRVTDGQIGGIESVWGKREREIASFETEREEIRNLDDRGEGRAKDRHER